MANKAERKNPGKWTKGGLRSKVFILCMLLVITAICGFAIVGVIQLRSLQYMARSTGEAQADAIREQSEQSMMEMTEDSMKNIVVQAADNTDWEMWQLRDEAVVLAAQVQDVFAHPENYGQKSVYPPDAKNAGTLTLQLLFSETADPTDEDMVMAEKLANLEPTMAAMMMENDFETQDLIIAFPCGMSLDMDTLSDRKFNDDGSLRPYNPNVRPWWKDATETGDVVLTHAVHSNLLDVSEIEFGVPVYVDDRLVAVVESSVRTETFQTFVSEVNYGESSFSIVVSDDGTLVYSPFDEGELKMDHMLSTQIYNQGNEELDRIIEEALTGEVGFSDIKVDGKEYCVAYAPMITSNWTQMMFVDREELKRPTEELLVHLDETTHGTLEKYEKGFAQSALLITFVMMLLLANAILVALLFSGKLTSPINRMTEAVRQISGDNFNFEMDDIYRTGDEIELLAETFGELSERTKRYIREIMEITSEKERIGAELSIATKIQADMLPKDFPMFPERNEFEVFATMTPAKEVAGDFYDIFLIDEDHLCLVIADVSGKGIPAALFMMVAKNMLENRAMQGGTPAEIFADVNKRLGRRNEEGMFVTVWLAIVTLSTGQVIESNAGHENPVIRRHGGEYEYLQTPHGLVLGVMAKAKYKDYSYELAPGDSIFVYTDGIPEAVDAKGERYGTERLLEVLNHCIEDDPEELIGHIHSGVDDFAGEVEQFDDLTMLSFKYHGNKDV